MIALNWCDPINPINRKKCPEFFNTSRMAGIPNTTQSDLTNIM
jgi:hypothetical protein